MAQVLAKQPRAVLAMAALVTISLQAPVCALAVVRAASVQLVSACRKWLTGDAHCRSPATGPQQRRRA
eukprot:COSAG01_NODE_47551_length_389_cov_0.889655_1_plen_67_part_01